MRRGDRFGGYAAVGLSRRERAVVDEMKRAAGVVTDTDLLRLALFAYGQHLLSPRDQAVTFRDVFALEGGRGARRKKQAAM